MAAIDKRFSFTPHSKIFSDEVNTNFDEIISFLNNKVVHVDGAKAFTGVPVLPSLDPSLANHATRKSYVDAKVANLNAVKHGGMSGTSPTAGGFPTSGVILKGGRNSGATNGNGDITIDFGGAFPHGVLTMVVTPVQFSGQYNYLKANVALSLVGAGSALVRVSDSTTGNSMGSTNVNICWLALGW